MHIMKSIELKAIKFTGKIKMEESFENNQP